MKRISRPGCCLTLFFMVLISAGCTHVDTPDEIFHRQDIERDWGTRPPDARDRAWHNIAGEKPFEWWYFDGHLDNGQTFVGVFHMPSFLSGKPAASFSLYTQDWSREDHVKEFEPEAVRASTGDIEIEMPAGFARRIDDRNYHVRWQIDDIDADFTITTEAPGWSPTEAGGTVNTESRDFFWVVHQGRNRITGTITKNGKATRVTGVGYADHNWGKRPLNDITRRWVWGRVIAGEYTIIYADVDYYDPAVVSRPLYIAKGDRIIVGTGSPAIRQWDFETHPVLKRYYPRGIALTYTKGKDSIDLRIKKHHLVEEVDLLSIGGYKGISHWFIQTFIARPAYFRVMAEYEGTITVDGKSDLISGECLYEVMSFE